MWQESPELLDAALKGNEQARARLLEQLRPHLVRWAAVRMPDALRSKIDAEDAAQEIILTLHTHLDQFREGNFRAWMFTVARNKLRDMAEQVGAQKRRAPEPVETTQSSPSQAAIRLENAEVLREAVARLPADYRRVIELRQLEGRDIADVAAAMNRSPNAIRILYSRAVKLLREDLDPLA